MATPTPDEVDAADQWWEDQPEARRVQICRWITQRSISHVPEVPGQLELLEGDDFDGSYESAV